MWRIHPGKPLRQRNAWHTRNGDGALNKTKENGEKKKKRKMRKKTTMQSAVCAENVLWSWNDGMHFD